MSSPQEKALQPITKERVEGSGPGASGNGVHVRSNNQTIRLLPILLAILSTPLAMAQGPAPAVKEQSAELNALYVKSMESFGKSEFKACVDGLKEMIAKGAEGPGLESVRFTIGSALFNLKEYKNAKEAFDLYLKEFPAGSKAMEATTAIGQCLMNLGDKAGALKSFAELSQKPGVNKERMLLIQGNLLKEMKNTEQALALLRPAVTGILGSDESVQLAALLASLEVYAGNPEAAFKLLNLLYQRFDVVENPLQVNGLAFEIGDALLNKKEFKSALRSYALVRRKEDVIALQKQKLQFLIQRYDANLAAIRQTPEKLSQLQASNVELKSQFDEGKRVLDDVEKAEDYMLSLRFRQARVYQELKRPWGTIVLFESLLKGETKATAREDMMFSICGSHAELQNTNELNKTLELYLKEFPSGKYVSAVNYMRGTQLLRADDLKGAATLFGTAVKNNTAGDKLEITLFLWGNALFGLSEWDASKDAYAMYLNKFAKGEYAEESSYRLALCHFFKGDYEKALAALESYLKSSPDGPFAPDAEYRVAACYMAAERAADVVKRCEVWAKNYGYHALMPEVMSLMGDAYVSLEKREEAAAAYVRGVQLNGTDEVLNYLLFEANKQYQKLGQWEKSTVLFKDFIDRNPKHPAVVQSMYWLAKALVKEGKPDEAKAFLSEKIHSFIKDRNSDAVEQLLTQLAQLCAKKPRPIAQPPVPAPTAPPVDGVVPVAPVVAVAPTPEAPPFDPEVELDKYLSMKKAGVTELGRGRVYFGRAELARMTRRPKEAAELMDRIAKEIAPKDLGASLLALSGDRMLERRELAKATALYKELMTAFPKSEQLDYAYNGLGQIAMIEKRYAEALKWFVDAVDKIGATTTLKDVTLGRGRALLELEKLDEAKAIFEQVAATKEWKGSVTADALFHLGELAFRKNDYTTAAQLFQRVTVAYQRYPGIVVRSYLRAADAFEKLGEPAKAKAQLQELLSKEKLAALPEVEEGRKRLEAAQ